MIGEVNYNSLAITQSGTDLTAKLVSERTGLACTYTGISVPEPTWSCMPRPARRKP